VTGYLYIPFFTRAFQQELVYSTDQLGPFHAVVGAFYFNSNGGFDPLNVNNFLQTVYTRDKAKSWAGFGELTYDVTDRLRLSGGMRYSHDNYRAYAVALLGTRVRPTTIPKLGEQSWHAWTPRASVLFKATDRTNLYVTYSKGYKAGVFNTVSFQRTPVNPEKVTSFEGGVKSDEFNHFSFSAAAFHYTYKDLQLPTIISTGATFVQELRNAARAKIYGAEIDGTWQATDAFSLRVGGTYLHARYSSFPSAVVNVPTGTGGNRTIPVDASGNVVIRSPTWSGNMTARYVQDTNVGTFDAAATVFASSKVYFDIGDRVVQPAYALVNASLAWRPPGTGAEFRLWGKNLTDHAVIYGTTITNAADGVNYAPPRTYGVEISYRF
jgi:iron complex outermembrane receptor protein